MQSFCVEYHKLHKLILSPNISIIYEYYKKKYLHKYHISQSACTDPFKNHKKWITKDLRQIIL